MNFWQQLKNKKKPILALAPMAGITDSAFRLLCRKFGADVVYSEMISIDALYYDSKKTLEMLKIDKKEQPVVCQLFGKRPELIPKAVKKVEEAGFAGIDLNFGCPARKVVNHGGGVSLLRDLDLVYELVKTTIESTSLPVSVKTRTSINVHKNLPAGRHGTKTRKHPSHSTGHGENTINKKFVASVMICKSCNDSQINKVTVFDFVEKLKDLPVAALMLHGRSYEQGFVDEVDFEVLKEANKQFKGVFLANGNLNKPEDVKNILAKTGADGVGLARGLYGKPWLFKQTKDFLAKGKYSDLSLKKIKKIALEHAELLFKLKGDRGLFEIRKHLTWYFKGFPQAKKFRKELVLVESIVEFKKILKKI